LADSEFNFNWLIRPEAVEGCDARMGQLHVGTLVESELKLSHLSESVLKQHSQMLEVFWVHTSCGTKMFPVLQ